MSDSSISLKTVNDLRVNEADEPIRYHIPAYQRGYRWSPTQVTQLLDDIREFTNRENPGAKDFYCLQPIVLRANDDGSFEVVDGQQRLTTLLLILRYFNKRLTASYQQKLYRLEYATRQDLYNFLDNPSPERAASNIDFFHIHQAEDTISEWFNRWDNEVDSIRAAFLNKAMVIWFQLSVRENAVAAFTRLNVGKIPLTNGELIRALFLKRANGGPPGALQFRIAHEWDAMEKTLQGGDFWCFLSNDTERRGNRVDIVFDLVARQQGMKPGANEYDTFNHFSQTLTSKEVDLELEWLAVKRTFMLLDEWFADRHLYHLVGYLIWAGEDVKALLGLAAGATKREFKESLKANVLKRAFGTSAPIAITKEWIGDQLDTLEYGSSPRRIRSILLLFNLATLLQNRQSNLRFQFESFKTSKWDIEHVRSVTPDRTPKGKRDWLIQCHAYLESVDEEPELRTEIQVFMDLPVREATDTAFDVVYEKILHHFRESIVHEADNGISNLVLLDYATNRSYGNAVFAVKRRRVLSLDRDGVFVPLCTRNVFLKCYSQDVDHVMYWTREDSEAYRLAMVDTLYSFFSGAWIHERPQ